MQTSLEQERTASNEQLIAGFREQLAACITQPVNEIASSLECYRAKFETIEEITSKPGTVDDDPSSNWHETVGRIESKLEKLDVALSAVKSLPTSNAMLVTHDESDGTMLDRKQAAIDHIATNLEDGVVSPLQELITSTERLRQALSDDEAQMVEEIVSSGDEMLVSTKLVASNLLEEIRGLTAHIELGEASPTTNTDQLHRYCEDLDLASKALLRHSSAIETQLEQLIHEHSNGVSNRDEAELAAEPSGERHQGYPGELDALPTNQDQPPSGTQQRALEILRSMAVDDNSAISREEITDEDIDYAMHELTKQARQNWEVARRGFIDKIGLGDGVIEELTRQWTASSATVSNDLRQLIDAVPTDWLRQADEISSAAERTVHLALGDTRQLFEQSTSAVPPRLYTAELKQTVDALELISSHLVRQTEKSRDVLTSQIVSTVSVIERSSTSVLTTTSRRGDQLSDGARAVANDILESLVATSAELDSITRESNETALPALANLLQDASFAREMIKSEIMIGASQSGETDSNDISSLHETIFEIANTIASLSQNLTVTTDRLVQALQTLSNDIRVREGQFAMENPSLLETDMAAYTSGAPYIPLS